jgi:hypothetical protein
MGTHNIESILYPVQFITMYGFNVRSSRTSFIYLGNINVDHYLHVLYTTLLVIVSLF